MPPLSRPVIVGGLVVGVVAVSTAAILSRYAMGTDPQLAGDTGLRASALALAFWRTALGSVALAPFGWRAARRGQLPRLGARRHRALAGSGLALGLHFALFQGSLTLTTVASATTLATMSPIFVAMGGWWVLREPTQRRTWGGMGLTIVGAIVIGVADASAIDLGPRALVGDALAFGSALMMTVYLLVGRATRRHVANTTYSAIVYAWAASALAIACAATGTSVVGYDPVTWAAIAGIVIGPQLLGHTVFNAVLSAVPATVVSIAVLAEPVGAGLLAWVLLDELPAPLFAIGAPLVLIGVAIATIRRRGAREAAEITAIEH